VKNHIYEALKTKLQNRQYCWLVTGAAGFIGSHLVQALLQLNQKVIGLDNFSTGHRSNLQEVLSQVSLRSECFALLEGDIRNLKDCQRACEGVDFILHQAALGSVPRSIEDPKTVNDVNVSGFLNVMLAAKENHIKRVVYASSSAVYGDSPDLPKRESKTGNLLSPYAATKYANELYAGVFARAYGFESIGLRYFNVFGARQDPKGDYAAVIPKWISSLIKNEAVTIYGDGSTSRDFCFVDNVVQANLLAAFADKSAANQVYNIAFGKQTTLLQLFEMLRLELQNHHVKYTGEPIHKDFRPGDIQHSLAEIALAEENIGYVPENSIEVGIRKALPWYIAHA
jgi:UDP-N-acetylglucosamine/UDP-N-acetylgalactosamine 4-epimerase